MKHTKPICLILITIFIFTPVLHKETKAAEHPYVEEWDFSGTRHLPKHRQMVFPIGALDPYRMRTFVYLLDEDGIRDTVEKIVAIYGVQSVRNAPFYSEFFEETTVVGLRANYSFKIAEESGIQWKTLNYDDTDVNSTGYHPKYHFLYNQIASKLKYRFEELFVQVGGSTTDEMIMDINLAYLTEVTGLVGYWQIIYEDGTLVNGNFSTFGPTNPIFWGPGQNTSDPRAYDYDEYWPSYNLTIAQNVERSSLPRTHSMSVSFPFLFVASSFAVLVLLITLKRNVRRKQR